MNTPSPSTPLQNRPIPVQAKIAAAWTSFMFLYIYVDYYHLHKPEVIDNLRAGQVFEFAERGALGGSLKTKDTRQPWHQALTALPEKAQTAQRISLARGIDHWWYGCLPGSPGIPDDVWMQHFAAWPVRGSGFYTGYGFCCADSGL